MTKLTDDLKAKIDDAVQKDYEWLTGEAQSLEAWEGITADDIGPLEMGGQTHLRVDVIDKIDDDYLAEDAVAYARDRWRDPID